MSILRKTRKRRADAEIFGRLGSPSESGFVTSPLPSLHAPSPRIIF